MTVNIRHASNHAPERYISSRGFALWLMTLFLLIFISVRATAQFAGGAGTAQSPYLVSNVTQLQAIRNASNTAHFRLTNDIDASATSGWNGGQGFNPIGWFGGVLDGNGFTISNLVINRPGVAQAALVSQLGADGIITNLTLQDMSVIGGNQAAGIAGAINGLVSNISVSGSVRGTTNVGGLVGQAYNGATIADCHADVTVTGSSQNTGGLVGYINMATILESSSSGSVSGTNGTGGLAGRSEGTVLDCFSTSNVTGGADTGGLIGHVNDGTVENSYATGTVSGNTNTGGLLGFIGWGSSAYVKTSYASGSVTASGNQSGGLIGKAQGVLIENTFARGSVNSGNNRVGGLIGEALSCTIRNSFSTGSISPNAGQAGGLIGRGQHGTTGEGTFWDMETSGWTEGDFATGQTTNQMKAPDTYAGWDFTNIWSIDPNYNDGYPFLRVFLPPQPPQDFTWTGTISTDWHTAGNWNTNTVPVNSDNIIIPNVPNKPVISTSVEITGITIDSGSSLTIAESGSLTVTGQLINNAGASGLIIWSSANGTGSFIYNGDVMGSFQRYIGNSETWQLLSSPVASQEISGDFTPTGTYGDGTGYDFYTWHEPDTAWVYLLNTTQAPTWTTANGGGNQFIPGRGYLVSYQQTGTKIFSGNFNHSQVNIPMTKSGDYVTNLDNDDYSMFSMNLAGNPYPSSIDWKAQSGWGRNDLEQTGGGYDIWIWSASNGNYGVYNSGSSGDIGTLSTSRYIAPTQGFFVRARALGESTLTINTGVKSHQGSGNWINKSGSDLNTPGKLHLRIEDRNGNGADEVIVEFGHTKNTKTPGSPKLFSMIETAPSLYIPKDKKSYSIRRLKTPDQNPLLPLSFIAGTDGEYVIKAAFDFTDMDMVVLEDLHTKQTHDFKTQGDYTFFATVKDKAERFQIRFKEGNYANPHAQLPVSAFTHNKTLAIDLRLVDPGETCLVEVFDTLGRKVFEGSYSGNSLYEVTLDGLQGAFMVQISTRQASYGGKVMFF